MRASFDNAYLAARAVQFFTPGVPQVYYVGLLAGENDLAILEQGGEGRDINRHNYSLDEVEQEVKKDAVQRLLKLIRFRNECPAFDGQFNILASKENEVHLFYQKDHKRYVLEIDLENFRSVITYVDEHEEKARYLV